MGIAKWVAAAILAASLTGCAQTPVDLGQNVALKPWGSAQAVDAARFPAQASSGDLEFCVARSLVNDSVTLSDSSDSFFGVYSGAYYHDTDSEASAGGEVMQHASDKGVIAAGIISYQPSSLVKRFVRFKLIATPSEYEFTNLEQAQANSGAAPNTGFNPVGAFSGAHPELVLNSLEEVARQIDRCRSG